jgi:eukaryotic-like serine/threonine-protein kinase
MPTELDRGVQLNIQLGQGASRVEPQGDLDGDLDLPPGPVVVSLDRVNDRIDIEATVGFAHRLAVAEAVLTHVPSSLMSFWSLLPPPPSVTVASFYAPYVCVQCKMRFEVLIDRRQHSQALQAGCAPSQMCASCTAPSAFVEDPSFLFLVAAPLPKWPAAVHALLGSLSSGRTTTIEAQLVTGPSPRALAVWLSGSLAVPDRLVTHTATWSGPVLVMAADVVSTDDRSVDRLKQWLGALHQPWLVSLSPELAHAMSMTLHGFAKAQVASVRLPFRCLGCGTVPLDIGQGDLDRLLTMPCPTCQSVLQPAFHERVVMMLHTIPMTTPPADIVAAMVRARRPSQQQTQTWTETPSLQGPLRGIHSLRGPGPATPLPVSTASVVPAADVGSQHSIARFEIIRRLGVGGMAETMLGRQLGIAGFEKRVVIKQILPELATQPAFVDMFLHEARVAARINHSNVVQIFDFGRTNNQYYIVMEYVRGHDLAAIMRLAQRHEVVFPIELAVRVVIDLCAGLSAAHSAVDDDGNNDPIIHRDVSPHNILVSVDGLVKLADFGIARVTSKEGNTNPGQLKGKVVYMAPETLRSEPPTTKIDIYAAGLVLYTLLAGKHPFNRGNDIQNMYAVAHEQLPSILAVRRDIPFSLAAVVGRAVNRDPSQRFANAQAMQLHLENVLAELGQPATSTHLALWVNQLMNEEQNSAAHDANHEATPSSSMALLELGRLHITPPSGEAERTRVLDSTALTHPLSDHFADKKP